MAEILGIAASIVALLQLSGTVIKYLGSVKDAPEELSRLVLEVSITRGLLSSLQDLDQLGEQWSFTVQSLGLPLHQIQSTLQGLAGKLAPRTGKLDKAIKTLVWPFQKDEIKEILRMIERQKTILSLALQNNQLAMLQAIMDEVTTVKIDLQVGQEDQKRRDVMSWLSPLNFSANQNDFFDRRQEGTGQWLLEADVFNSWLAGTEGTLWCPGFPGAGKTVLTSIIVNYLERSFNQEDVAIAYVYCSYTEQEDQTTVNLIASLLQQLLQRNCVLRDEIFSSLYEHQSKQTRPALSEYSTLFQSAVRGFSNVFIVIDALDECSETNGTRQGFLAEIRKVESQIHLLVTSRHSTIIAREFEKAARLEIRASNADVKKYLEGRIMTEPQFACHVKGDLALQNTIIETIVQKVEGMFLLAKLHMDSLAKKDNRRDIRRALPNLPKELDDTYEEAMKRILNQDPDKVKRAMQVLSWISYALGPLTVSDIRHALAVEPGDTNLDEDALPHEDLLVSVCAGLVTIDQGSNVIRLVHYTTQKYFERIREARFPKAQTSIAMTCLTYLSFEEFAKGHSPSDQEMETRLRRYPLLDYAARHWGTHARGEPEEAVKESALKFLTHNSKLMCSNQVMHLQEYRYANYSQRFPKDVTGLHVAASFGLATIARLLLENDVNLAAKTESGSTALHWAARNGHQEVVRLFLEKGTSIDDNSKSPVLHLAAENCHEEVVRLLLEKGVSVDMGDDSGRKALHLAARKGHEKVVQLLLDNGADIDAKDDENESTALHEAAENGKETVVKLLLEKGATVELKDADGRIALHWASEGGHEIVVPLLLQKGVKINMMDNSGWTALGSAVERGHVAVVHLLLENGADIEVKNGGLTALQWAAERGNEEVLRLLLEKGADIGAKDDHGKTALHWAAERGNEEVLRLLLEKGADIGAKDDHGKTALHWATARGHATIVQQLLAKKIDLATTDENGNTALHEAAEAGYETVAQLLLDSGCDIKAKNNLGYGLLHLAVARGHYPVVWLLLTKGADLQTTDTDGWTALQYATRDGNEKLIQLLEKGIQI